MQETSKKTARPPIVAILGHIDHGKSSVLDYIRKTNVVGKEHGGITQHIKTYEAEFELEGKKKKITFLDTPGHEAFCGVRERGSNIADIAVLIISAEDGVKPQTIESIKCIKESKTPFVVAINKTDKPGANVDKVKQELAEHEIFVEGWGGNVSAVATSAKTGQGINELLETLVLQAEVEGLSGDPEIPAEGFVIESEKDPKKGIISSLVIKNGTLKKGMFLNAGHAIAPVRMLEDFQGRQIEEASLSKPIRIAGWTELPPVGSAFHSFYKKEGAEKEALKNKDDGNKTSACLLGLRSENQKIIPLIIKTDAIGSLEAIKNELGKLSNEKILLKTIEEGVGSVSLNDVKLALASEGAILISFNVKIDPTAESLAARSNLPVHNFNIIYDLLDWMKKEVLALTPTEQVREIAGEAKVLKTFSKNKNKQVIGGRVEEGELKLNDLIKIFRREAEIGEGKVKELQMQKIAAGKVEAGAEFGVLVDSKIEIVPGDKMVSYRLVTK